MVVKTGHAPLGQQPIRHPRKLRPTHLRQTATRVILNTGLPILTLFAVFSGMPGSREHLEEMGIHLGPNHL